MITVEYITEIMAARGTMHARIAARSYALLCASSTTSTGRVAVRLASWTLTMLLSVCFKRAVLLGRAPRHAA